MTRHLAALAFVVLASACGGNDAASTSTDRNGLAPRTVRAGAVTVEIGNVRVSEDGASFRLTLDTHSVELDMDVTEVASLTVGGKEWKGARWTGDPPGGHHREGRLTFDAAGPARGEVVLTLDGLPEAVRTSWQVP